MLKQMRDRVRAAVGRRAHKWLDAVILPRARHCAAEAAEPVNYQKLALELSTLQEFMRELRDRLEQVLADDDMAERVAQHIDCDDVARHVDCSEIAGEIDKSEIAAEFTIDEGDVADALDYKRLAKALLQEVGVAK
jgi:hypothetical protein